MRDDRMQEARLKEHTATMRTYSQVTHNLKIEQEGSGFLGVSIRNRQTRALEGFAVVPKHRHGTGSTYLFRDATRLSELCIEPEQVISPSFDLRTFPITEWLTARRALGVTIPEGWAPKPVQRSRRERLRR